MLGVTFTIKIKETEVDKLEEILKQSDVTIDEVKSYSDNLYYDCRISSYKNYKLLLEELDRNKNINALLIG